MNIINLLKIFLNYILTFLSSGIDQEIFKNYLCGIILQDRYFCSYGISKRTQEVSLDRIYNFLEERINWTKIFYALGKLISSILYSRWYLLADATAIIQEHAENRITPEGFKNIEGRKNIPQNEAITIALTNGKIYIPLDFVIWVSEKVLNFVKARKKTDIFYWLLHKYNLMRIPVKTICFDSFFTSKKILNWLIRNGYTFFTRMKKNRTIYVNGDKFVLENYPLEYGQSIVCKLKGIKSEVKILKLQYQEEDVFVCTNDISVTDEELERKYRDRWGIEVFHRQAKQTLGLEYVYIRSWKKLNNHVGFVCLAYSLLSILSFLFSCSTSDVKYMIQDKIFALSNANDRLVQLLRA